MLKEKLGELPPKKKRENILKSIRGGKGKDKKEPESKEKSALDPLLKYENSITARLNDNYRIKADGVVFFPHNFSGNTVTYILFSTGFAMASTLISSTYTTRDCLLTHS